MASITTRAGKGSALTWTEADNNITNLNTAKIENVVEDLTPQLGGALDVNGKVITNTLSGSATSIDITTKDIKLIPGVPTIGSDGKVSINNQYFLPNTDGANGQVLGTDGAGTVSFKTVLIDVVNDTTPQLGGDLDVNGKSITSASNGAINITPNGSGNISLAPATGKIILGALEWPTSTGTNGQVLTTNGTTAASWTTVSAGATTLDELTDVVITAAATNDVLVYNGTNWVDTAANTLTVSAASTATTATGATNIAISTTDGNAAETTLFPVFVSSSATGNQLPHIDSTGISYNASTNALTATTFVGALTGNATSATSATSATTATGATNINISSTDGNANDTTLYPVMVGANSTGNQLPHTDTGMVFNATTNTLTLGSSGASNAGGLILFGASTANNITIATPSLGGSITLTLPSATGTLLNSNGTLTGVFNGSTVTASSSITPNNTGGANINFGTSGLSASAWTTLGISIRQQARTYTDSSSTGTVAVSAINGFGIPTLGSTNAITVTDAASLYIADGPTAGTNTTITNKWALLTAGNIKAAGATIGGTTLPTATGTTGQVLALSSAGVAAWTTSSGSAPSITDDTASATTHYLIIDDATSGALGPKTSSTKLTFVPSTGVLTATGFSGPHNGTVGATTPAAGTFTTMTANTAVLDDIRETVFALTYGATITPDAANGSVQTVTLTGNVTFSAFANPVSGQTITLIITQDATGSRTLTSTMKFAGGSKTLSTAANSIDILTVSYIGTTYYASLSKGFA